MMQVIKAPNEFRHLLRPWVFLAGSIEMGKAVPWQGLVEGYLTTETGTILNPRRDDWDSSWLQEIENAPFREQVEWELGAMELADKILLYLAAGTKSPISLLEFGLFLGTGRLIVCCPVGFWRKGNVDIVCERYGIHQVNSLHRLADAAHGTKTLQEQDDER